MRFVSYDFGLSGVIFKLKERKQKKIFFKNEDFKSGNRGFHADYNFKSGIPQA